MSNSILSTLEAVAGKIKTDEPMNLHTSFRIGGPAGYFVDIDSLVTLIRKRCDEVRIIGE